MFDDAGRHLGDGFGRVQLPGIAKGTLLVTSTYCLEKAVRFGFRRFLMKDPVRIT